MAKLLVSPKNLEEIEPTVKGGADIVDIKRPAEGSLGANFPWILEKIQDKVPNELKTSAAIGDMGYQPGTAALAALTVSLKGFDYVKVGLYGVDKEQGLELVDAVVKSVKNGSTPVIAGYGDYRKINGLKPLDIVYIASETDAGVAMLDTALKNGKTLFEKLKKNEVKEFLESAEAEGLKTALAGSLDKEAVKIALNLGADIVGVRGAACGGDRSNKIEEKCVKQLAEVFD